MSLMSHKMDLSDEVDLRFNYETRNCGPSCITDCIVGHTAITRERTALRGLILVFLFFVTVWKQMGTKEEKLILREERRIPLAGS